MARLDWRDLWIAEVVHTRVRMADEPPRCQIYIDAAQKRPEGAQFRPDLYMATDGGIWWCHGDDVRGHWYQLHRSSQAPLAPYRRTKRFSRLDEIWRCGFAESATPAFGDSITFEACSFAQLGHDWAWEILPAGAWPPPEPTLEVYTQRLQRAQAALDLLVKLDENRDDALSWLERQAQEDRSIEGDWAALLAEFMPELIGQELHEDIGRIRATLQTVLDVIATGIGIRRMMFNDHLI